jgi:hypothetical protein
MDSFHLRIGCIIHFPHIDEIIHLSNKCYIYILHEDKGIVASLLTLQLDIIITISFTVICGQYIISNE